MTPLDAGQIARAIPPGLRGLPGKIRVLEEVPSTNDFAWQLPRDQLHGCVVLAESQTAGKGRREKRWSSPPGNLYMSIGWRFAGGLAAPGLVPLAAGIAVCTALAGFGLTGHGIKWPNDVRVGSAKLCGILVEARSRGAAHDTVCGIGLNVEMGEEAGVDIAQPWTELARHLAPDVPSRNELAAAIIGAYLGLVSDESKLAGRVMETWPQWDLLHGREVKVLHSAATQPVLAGDDLLGTAGGIDALGALCLETPQGSQAIHAGEVSVREA